MSNLYNGKQTIGPEPAQQNNKVKKTLVTQSAQHAPLITRKQIRTALKGWNNVAALGGSTLASQRFVQAHRSASDYADTPAGRGIALRQLLSDALEQLRPDGEMADFTRSAWRRFYILNEQFVQRRRAHDIRTEMGVSESGYFNDQRRGLDDLAAICSAWEAQELGESDGDDNAELVSIAGPVIAPEMPPHESSLPYPTTPFIGREPERARIAELLNDKDVRLISLVGPGGMGKTRLAIQTAVEHETEYTPFFVQLDTLEDSDLLIYTIAQTVHLTLDSHANGLSQLVRFLRGRRWLVILDNFEHLTNEGAAVVAQLLKKTPQIKWIVTSRERLNLRGEWVIDLHGLDVPLNDSRESFYEFSAVRLFVDAIQRVRSGRALNPEELPTVVEICGLVAGMPLGIELAASWGNILSCREIAQEIQDSTDFLESAYRDLPERHQSLRAVFNHSWTLLDPEEKRVFCQLAIFRGSFDRSAARDVTQASLPLLHRLIHKSLLMVTDHGRYAVHSILRQFAQEKLEQRVEEWGEVQLTHATFYARFMREHIVLFKQGNQQKEAFVEAERELENIRLAWRWALSESQDEMMLGAVESIYYFFALTNRFQEGVEAAHLIVTHFKDQPHKRLSETQKRLLGMAQGVEARFVFLLGDISGGRALFMNSLRILERYGSTHELALIQMLAIPANLKEPTTSPSALYKSCIQFYQAEQDRWAEATCHVSYVDYLRTTKTADDYHEQRSLMAKSLRLRQQIGDQLGVANCLNYLCDLAYARGGYAEAREYATESLALHEVLGNHLGRAHSLSHLGQVAGSLGDYDDAHDYYWESLNILRSYGTLRETADCLDSIGYITYLLGDIEEAEGYYQESLRISQEIGDVHGEAWSLHNLGDVARARGDYKDAKDLYSASRDLHQTRDALSWGGAVAVDKLGRVTMLIGRMNEAESHFLAALHIATVTERKREALDAIFNVSRLLILREEKERAADFLALVMAHPATAKQTRDEAEQELELLTKRSSKTPRLTLRDASVLLLNGRLKRPYPH